MNNLVCHVIEQDRFYREMILEFIDQTTGLSLADNKASSCDIVFADYRFKDTHKIKMIKAKSLVVISSDKAHIHSYFKNEISDYLFKPDLSYTRFLESINRIKRQLNTSNSTAKLTI